MNRLHRYGRENFVPGPGTLTVMVGMPGSGKTRYITSLLNDIKTRMILDESQRPRLLLVSSGGASSIDFDRSIVSRHFDYVKEGMDLLFELGVDKMESMVGNYASSVIVLDDLVLLSSKELARLVRFLYVRLRHSNLTVLCSIHSATHLTGIQSLIRMANIVTVHPCAANTASIRRMSQIFGWDRGATECLLKELMTMQFRHTFNAILLAVPTYLAVTGVVSKPFGKNKTVHRTLKMTGVEPPSWYYLVPEKDLRVLDKTERKRLGDEQFLALFSLDSDRKRVKDVLSKLDGAANLDYELMTVTCGDRKCNLLDLCMTVGNRRRTPTKDVSSVVKELEKKGVRLCEVGTSFCFLK
jgi:hypothetical protein